MPERDVPPLPWAKILAVAITTVIVLTALWEWHSRSLGYGAGDIGDDPAAWSAQWRRLASDRPPVVIIGDSRILFDTDLDLFQRMTGARPVQLALAGTNALPVLEKIAKSDFGGLVIVGIADQNYFRSAIGAGGKSIDAADGISPSAQASSMLYRSLRRRIAMLDDDNQLSRRIARWDGGWIHGVRGPYDEVWKVGETHEERQFMLWPRIERDGFLRAHAIRVWMTIFHMLRPDAATIANTRSRTRIAVSMIRAHGGEVVFVRPPSAPPLRAVEDSILPRSKGWDPLLKAANVKGIHADDMPRLRGIAIPEMSHISGACQKVFTDAYVRALTVSTPRLGLRADIGAPLSAKDCSKGPGR